MQYDTIKKEIRTAHMLWPINAGTFDFYNYLKTKPAYVLSLMLRDKDTSTKLRDEIIFYLDRGK
jgi:hypothetical protein